jgi:hypothetical protein
MLEARRLSGDVVELGLFRLRLLRLGLETFLLYHIVAIVANVPTDPRVEAADMSLLFRNGSFELGYSPLIVTHPAVLYIQRF